SGPSATSRPTSIPWSPPGPRRERGRTGRHGHGMRRVAVTGLGVVSPIGNGAAAFFEGLAAGRSGVRRLAAPFSQRLAMRVAAQVDIDTASRFPAPKLRMLDRVSQLALIAAAEAIAHSGDATRSTAPERAGAFVGVGVGGPQA